MPKMDLSFAQKILYGNSKVFVVPPTASYWLEWQEGLKAAVEKHGHHQQSAETEPLELSCARGCFPRPTYSGTLSLAEFTQG